MAHAARIPPLVLCLDPYENIANVLEVCKGMDSRKYCCVVVPAGADAENESLPVLVPEPEPAAKCGNLPVIRIPLDLYNKFARNASEHGVFEYHNMMHDNDSYPHDLSKGHFDFKLYSITMRALHISEMRDKLVGSWDFEKFWHCPESGMQDAGELAEELDGTNKEEKYRAREQYLCDLWFFGTANLEKISTHQLFVQLHGLAQMPSIINFKVNTVGPWTLYDALYRHVESCYSGGVVIPGWSVFKEVCALQRPEDPERPKRPAKRRRVRGGAAIGGAAIGGE